MGALGPTWGVACCRLHWVSWVLRCAPDCRAVQHAAHDDAWQLNAQEVATEGFVLVEVKPCMEPYWVLGGTLWRLPVGPPWEWGGRGVCTM